jgi:hypothetical protein
MIIMRPRSILMSIFALLSVAATLRADDVPKRFNFDRYAAMLDHSPFAVATAIAAPAATPNFAKDLYLSSAAKSPDGDMITVISSADKNFRKYLTTKEPVDGYSIANIEWSDRVGETKATVSKDGQFATLSFNQALLSQPQPAVNQPQAAANSPQPPAQAGIAPPAAPAVPSPPAFKPNPPPGITPHVRGVIPRNPNNPSAPGPPSP